MCGVKGRISFRVCSLDTLCHTLHYLFKKGNFGVRVGSIQSSSPVT